MQYSPDLPEYVQQNILANAMSQWFNAIPQAAGCSRKRRSSDPGKKDADILVSFVKRQHGDPFPFDGAGGSVGHVFYPGGNTSKYSQLSLNGHLSRVGP